MARMKKWAISAALVLGIALLVPVTAFATTAGYFELGYSAANDGMAGAGVAHSEDSMGQATNPAGLAFVGSRFDIGAAGFWAFRGYTVGSTVPVGGFPEDCNGGDSAIPCGSSTNFFLIPHMGLSYQLGGGSAVGFAMYGNGGMNTTYKTSVGAPFYSTIPMTGVNFKQLFMQASYAYRFTRHDSVGLGLLYVRQYFSASGLKGTAFNGFTSNHLAFTNTGVDMGTGFGFRLGTQIRLMRGLSWALSYTPEIHMSRFNGYQGLFADHGDFNIPQTWTTGLAFKPTRHQLLAFDFQRIYYGGVPTIANTVDCMDTGSCKLGAENGPGFGWTNISVYKLGYQIATSRQWTWRVGYAYNTQPVNATQVLFNILAPGVIQNTITAGFTRHMGHSQDLTVAAMWGMNKTLLGIPPSQPSAFIGTAVPQSIYLHEYQVDANWGIKF